MNKVRFGLGFVGTAKICHVSQPIATRMTIISRTRDFSFKCLLLKLLLKKKFRSSVLMYFVLFRLSRDIRIFRKIFLSR